jgi:hypothetical protein
MLPIRHIFVAAAFAHISWIWIDTPKQVYFCPLNREGLANDWVDENCYWSTSYAEARGKFVSLGNRLREQLMLSKDGNNELLLNLLDVQSITYDIAENSEDYKSLQATNASTLQTISPEKDTVDAILLTMRVPDDHIDIIHSSGTHGVEGYLGSAIQIRFLHELFLLNEALLQNKGQEKASENGKVRKILLIHAVNPFGMRHHRRTNENNVDLNRNVLAADKIKTVIERDPNFFGYVDMDYVLNPINSHTSSHQSGNDLPEQSSYDTIHTFVKELGSIASVIGSIVKIIITKGYTNAKRSIVSAQYHNKNGVFFGGTTRRENSDVAVQHAIDKFAGFSLSYGNTDVKSKVFWIDVHTGLGKYGSYTLIEKEIPDKTMSWRSQLNTLITSLEETQASSSKAVSSGYEQTVGFINGEVLCPSPSCFAVSQEFGTRPGVAVILGLILENKGFHGGKREFAYLTSNAFQPQRLSWRRTTLRGGTEMLLAALKFQPR